jgi:hypothetical protein
MTFPHEPTNHLLSLLLSVGPIFQHYTNDRMTNSIAQLPHAGQSSSIAAKPEKNTPQRSMSCLEDIQMALNRMLYMINAQ